MSESKRRATRNKAYGLGHAAGAAGRECINPYIAGSASKAHEAYERGHADGKAGKKKMFEVNPHAFGSKDCVCIGADGKPLNKCNECPR